MLCNTTKVLGSRYTVSRFKCNTAPALALSRFLSTCATQNATVKNSRSWTVAGGAAIASCAMLQYFFGSTKDFYNYKFTTTKDPDDLATFYGSEDFMQIFCVLPFVEKLIMRNGQFDDEDKEADTNGDGKLTTTYFNKRERFRDVLFGVTLWEIVHNFGFQWNSDNTCQVYHHGESFYGPFPIRLLFAIHAKYVSMATKHHIIHHLGALTDDEEQLEEESRHNMPLHIAKELLNGLLLGLEKNLQKTKTLQRMATRSTTETESALRRLKTVNAQHLHASVTDGKLQIKVEDAQVHDNMMSVLRVLIENQTPSCVVDVFEEQIGHDLSESAAQPENHLH